MRMMLFWLLVIAGLSAGWKMRKRLVPMLLASKRFRKYGLQLAFSVPGFRRLAWRMI
ncbi:hypothetical protein B0H94_11623 [Salsuginibacillus halophilus]|uniref:Uncharacterized protein n=1 Tax=Salsuginibacillus halophilus TaxID=517424 RepID=A0A2P8H808_9BACI|nr:hypothetical protein [Salsuginibacillus halophilus]PSL42320.1 hypothetical protein B0H94_11623 [Salsuginibacillus halophilus]